MSQSAEAALQKAVYDALVGNVALMARVTAVKDWVPNAQGYPYVSIGESTAIPFDTQTTDGQEHTITIHTWVQGQGRKECKEIMSLIYEALHRASLSVTGHQSILCMQVFSEVLKDPDGITHHGVQRFRVITEDQ